MVTSTKIATCCYCGTRTVLALRGTDRHELSCARCAAPLARMKMLPVRAEKAAPRPASRVMPAAVAVRSRQTSPAPAPRKRQRRNGRARRIWAEIWDEIEDIFD
jgi:hypothetical protein